MKITRVKRPILTVEIENAGSMLTQYRGILYGRKMEIEFDFAETLQGRSIRNLEKFLAHLFFSFRSMKANEADSTFPNRSEISKVIDSAFAKR